MASRYFNESQREKLSSGPGADPRVNQTRSGKGHPLNDQRGEFGREHDSRPIEDTSANYKPAGPEGRGYNTAGAHVVKSSPGKQKARFG